jgi:hypothetical protein
VIEANARRVTIIAAPSSLIANFLLISEFVQRRPDIIVIHPRPSRSPADRFLGQYLSIASRRFLVSAGNVSALAKKRSTSDNSLKLSEVVFGKFFAQIT